MKKFKSNPKFYDANMRYSQTAAAVPASLKSPDGSETPGVAIITQDTPRLVVTLEAALKLAHEIADALDKEKK